VNADRLHRPTVALTWDGAGLSGTSGQFVANDLPPSKPVPGTWGLKLRRSTHRLARTSAKRSRSMARDLGRTTPPDFIASLLHRFVLPS
jgi:hypothetical protein